MVLPHDEALSRQRHGRHVPVVGCQHPIAARLKRERQRVTIVLDGGRVQGESVPNHARRP